MPDLPEKGYDMMRLIRLTYILFRANVFELFTYRASFFAGVFSVILWVALSLVSITIITYQSALVGGWSKYELFLANGIYSLVLGFMYFFFRANFRDVSRLIRLGDLDLVLVKPCDSQFLVSVGKFIIYQLVRMAMGIIVIIYSLFALKITPTLIEILLFVPLLISSVLIIYSLWFFIITLSIWFVDLFNLDELFIQLTGVTRYPLEIFKIISKFLMYVTLPLVVITTVPAQILLQKLNVSLVVWSLVISLSLFWLTRRFWQFALKYYTSASS